MKIKIQPDQQTVAILRQRKMGHTIRHALMPHKSIIHDIHKSLSVSDIAIIANCMDTGRQIEAVKEVRHRGGLGGGVGLREAKMFVDNYFTAGRESGGIKHKANIKELFTDHALINNPTVATRKPPAGAEAFFQIKTDTPVRPKAAPSRRITHMDDILTAMSSEEFTTVKALIENGEYEKAVSTLRHAIGAPRDLCREFVSYYSVDNSDLEDDFINANN